MSTLPLFSGSQVRGLGELCQQVWSAAPADLKDDLENAWYWTSFSLGGGTRPVSSVIELAILEPQVVQSLVSRLKVLPHGTDFNTEPGNIADGQPGSVYRPMTAPERAFMLVLYTEARREVGLSINIEGLQRSSSSAETGGTGAALTEATKDLVRQMALERVAGNKQKMNPKDWGDAADEQDMDVLSSDVHVRSGKYCVL